MTEGRRAQDRLEAASQITAALLLGATRRQVLTLLARRARELVGADLATIALPAAVPGSLVVEVAEGVGAEALVGELFSPDGSMATVMDTGEPVILADAGHDERTWQPAVGRRDIGPALLAPIGSPGSVIGTLGVANLRGGRRFGEEDVDVVQLFAAQTALVLEFARGQDDRQRVTLLEDRERIARDLHDTVIQRLFATGMGLQSLLRLAQDPPVADRVQQAVDDIDVTIRDIRSTIFALQATSHGVRAQLLDLVGQAAEQLGFKPRLTFEGPVDSVTSAAVTDHLLATAREALSNVARHAAATRVDVVLETDGEELLLRVVDDGRGVPPGGRRSGLQNMAERARSLGGTLALVTDEEEGTAVEWRVPLAADDPAPT